MAPCVNAFLHGLVALSMIFGYVAPAQASMADLYAKEPVKFGANMAQWGANFGLGCALGPFIGSRLQGPKSFFASAIMFLVAAAYMRSIPETLQAENTKKFKISDIIQYYFSNSS